MALNGFTKSLEPFVKGVCTQENFPNGRGFGMTVSKKRLERSQRLSRQGDGEKNLALVSWAKKGKGKHFKGNSEGSQSEKKKDLSKLMCFICYKNEFATSSEVQLVS